MERLPKEILTQHDAYCESDPVFRANCRYFQSIWRSKNNYPRHSDPSMRGNYLPEDFAKERKVNFLTDRVKALVEYEVEKAKADRRMIEEPRIWNNLLSSQPMCFNLFGELHYDSTLASRVFNRLFPDNIQKVNAIKFEYSPGLGKKRYTGDHSAFDAFVEYTNHQNESGFLAIEVKYTESARESKKASKKYYDDHEENYLSVANSIDGLFPDSSIAELKTSPIQQMWRNHLLALSTLQDYSEGFFVFLYPEKNGQCSRVVNEYVELMAFTDEGQTHFCPRTLETFYDALQSICDAPWVTEFGERYLGFNLDL